MKTTPQEEAQGYKDYSKKRLKKVIATYKFYKFLNNDFFNFIFSFLLILSPQIIIFGFNFWILIYSIIFHYFTCWLYVVKYLKIKLVTNQEKENIETIIKILKGYKD